jgi:lysophospholipase L1-like esterase
MTTLTDVIEVVAALGSSFAAGPTLEPVENAAAARSARNYPHLLAEALGCRLVDLTVSGATTSGILDSPQVVLTGEEFPPQIQGLPEDADLVTVTAGGNDLKLIGSLYKTALDRMDPDGPLRRAFGDRLPATLAPATDDQVDAVAVQLARIVTEVRARAPRARVVLVDYLSVVNLDYTRPDAALDTATLRVVADLQTALARAHVRAADLADADLLPMSTLSADHALGSPQPWVRGFVPSRESMRGSFHPNARGMQAVADALLELLGRGPLTR